MTLLVPKRTCTRVGGGYDGQTGEGIPLLEMGAKSQEPVLENVTYKAGHRLEKGKTMYDFNSEHTNKCLFLSNIEFSISLDILFTSESQTIISLVQRKNAV